MTGTESPDEVRRLFELSSGIADALNEYFEADKKLDKVFEELLNDR